jgi:hypothetical protein
VWIGRCVSLSYRTSRPADRSIWVIAALYSALPIALIGIDLTDSLIE